MNEENIPVITDKEELYDKCENMEQLFDKYYLPLLDKHYSKTYKLQQENKQLRQLNKIIYVDKSEHILEELKKWLEEGRKVSLAHENSIGVNFIEIVLDKIKELEEGVK